MSLFKVQAGSIGVKAPTGLLSYLKNMIWPPRASDLKQACLSGLPNEVLEIILSIDDDYEETSDWKSVKEGGFEYIFEITTERGVSIEKAPPTTALMKTCRRLRALGLRSRLPNATYRIFHNDIEKLLNFLKKLSIDEQNYLKDLEIFSLKGVATLADVQSFDQLCELISDLRLRIVNFRLPEVETMGYQKNLHSSFLKSTSWCKSSFKDILEGQPPRLHWKSNRQAEWLRIILRIHGGCHDGRFEEFSLADAKTDIAPNYENWKQACYDKPIEDDSISIHGIWTEEDLREKKKASSRWDQPLYRWVENAMTESWETRQRLLGDLEPESSG